MEQKELTIIKAEVEKITFQNAVTGFTVAQLSAAGESITAVGAMPDLEQGESVELCGAFVMHDTYGPQLRVQSYAKVLPGDAAAIMRYLSGGSIKGIGPATAKKIVTRFGEDTLRILEEEPLRLCEIKGISRDKAVQLGEEFSRRKSISTVLAFFNTYGIDAAESLKIYAYYGQNAIESIREDPYRLCAQEVGLDFQRVDAIAGRINSAYSSVARAKSGLEYVLRHNLFNGHTCLPAEKLFKVAAALLEAPQPLLEDACAELLAEGKIAKNCSNTDIYISLADYDNSEQYIANRLQMLCAFPMFSEKPVEKEIAAIENQQGITYAEGQRLAIRLAAENGMLILTGGPGTGKTTTVNAIIQILENRGLSVRLTAPTGRAANRLQELCGREAQTIHRLLEVAYTGTQDKPVFGRNEENPLPCDVLIIDEMSMVDVKLFEAILKALKLSCKLIMVGDADQLPSVSAGNVLYDLIAAAKFPCVQLSEIFRQARQSLIVTNAHRIIRGEMPELAQKDKDFFFIRAAGLQVPRTVVDLCCSRLTKAYGYSVLNDIQILCPTKITDCGTVALNSRIQAMINGDDTLPAITLKGYTLRLGDKVMMMKNNYEIMWKNIQGESGSGVFNGDIGFLAEVDAAGQIVKVQFEDKLATFIGDEILQLELAYAVTVHKSQGCEFPCVVLPLFATPDKLRYRNLLYTAVTRAKERLVLVGSEAVLSQMVENNRKNLRYSGLRDKLMEI